MSWEWHKHLCDYYKVTPEKALELGSRSEGRKPDLPGSETCDPVSEMTFEDIWELSERSSVEDIFKFYKDQGAWSTFRQCVRHKDMENFHISIFNVLIQSGAMFEGAHICEYGAGVAPFITTLLKYIDNTDVNLNVTITDVDCEHLNFAKYRLNQIKKDRNFKNINFNFETIRPGELPNFANKKLNALLCFEVLEHVPSPVDVIKNIAESMAPGGMYIENFIKHTELDDDDDGPDLVSARKEREDYYN